MSHYFTAAFFSESGFPSKAAFQEFSVKEHEKCEAINKQLSALVKQGQTIIKNFFIENHVEIKRLDQERKMTNKYLQAQEKNVQKKVEERYTPIDLSDEEITSYQPTNPRKEFEKNEIEHLIKTLKIREETIEQLERENGELAKQNSLLTQHYKMIRNAYVDITIEYETIRSSAPLPIKRKRPIIQ
jgi:hypothetical protein